MTWSSVMTYMCLRCPRICFSYRSHNPSFFAVLTYPLNWSRNSMTEAIILRTHPVHMHSTPVIEWVRTKYELLTLSDYMNSPRFKVGFVLLNLFSSVLDRLFVLCLSSVCPLIRFRSSCLTIYGLCLHHVLSVLEISQ